jgi:hypothetical protein
VGPVWLNLIQKLHAYRLRWLINSHEIITIATVTIDTSLSFYESSRKKFHPCSRKQPAALAQSSDFSLETAQPYHQEAVWCRRV